MELITYKQAAELLNVSQSTIHNAVARGDLTRYPMPGQTQHLIKEQALLFTSPKRRVAARYLDAAKRKQWQAYADSVKQPIASITPDVRLPASPIKQPETWLDMVSFMLTQPLPEGFKVHL